MVYTAPHIFKISGLGKRAIVGLRRVYEADSGTMLRPLALCFLTGCQCEGWSTALSSSSYKKCIGEDDGR